MENYFAFVDESGVLDESKKVQPFFAVGFLKILDTSIISEKLTQKHYDYFSTQKEKRKQLLQDLRNNPKMLTAKDLNLLLVSTRHYEYKFTNVTYTTLERYKSFLDTAWEFPLHFCSLIIDKTDPLFNSSIYKNYWRVYRAKAKEELVNHLINKLVIPANKKSEYPLAQDITINKPFYFSVWPLKLLKIK